AEHQEGGGLLGRPFAALGLDRLRGRHLAVDRATDRLRDAVGVDDHDYRAVAENGIAGEHRDVAQLARHRLDHDFLGVEHAVYHHAESLAADLGDNDVAALE